MKKMTLRLVMLVMAALLACAPALAEVDAFTSASVTDFYGDNALTGDELMNAINSFSGFYLVCTTNPDGSANAGYFIYGCADFPFTGSSCRCAALHSMYSISFLCPAIRFQSASQWAPGRFPPDSGLFC